ncbi:hypothetical protein COCMIDRAFT_91598 [Bipolaris oryzae ATCC 44560]|uniref:Uncharacterized protein n=1 Tax=Bipolaris oryzae ATCC 44560 TaxID=930090 RepID=W6ZT52_COCMI|nr:uncharacterized protein COCMIDRAFT_91598 [Bipolaris oryzae ATCC 44560]EUC46891.1 hypothetical protein COCMIDRAFT_91598 [Bipolaris oryzae ATCC 44560]
MNSGRPFNYATPYSGPFYHAIPGSDSRVYLNNKLTREEIDKAVQVTRQSQVRFGSLGKDSNGEQMKSNLLLRLPPEIRNRIAEYALDLGDDPAEKQFIVCPPSLQKPLCEGLSILSLCKQISAETRSMLEARATAYIPIIADMNFCKLVSDINEKGNVSLSEIPSTVFAGLTSFTHAHLHLHVNYHSSPFRRDLRRNLSQDIAHIYGVLKQALRIWGAASEQNFAHLKEHGLKRKAVLHLDHLFSDWRGMVKLNKETNMHQILKIMNSDTTTEWEVHYYVPVRGTRADDHTENWRAQILVCELNLEKIFFKPFPSIKLVPEVYGNLQDRFKNAEFYTERILPSSTLWPSWPEDAPWRMCPRVRSDEFEPILDRRT